MPGIDVVQYDDDLVNPHNRFAWVDIEGDVTPKPSAVGAPTFAIFSGNRRWFRYSASDNGDIIYHMPHHWAPGTEMHLHVHWGHNGTDISGSLVINCHLAYASRDGAFSDEQQIDIAVTGLTLANTPSVGQRVDEVLIARPGGGSGLFDSNSVEVDGLFHCHFAVQTIPTIVDGAAEPFIFTLDMHVLSDRHGTRNRSAPFYG